MNVSPRFVVLAALLVAAGSAGVLATACSSGGNNPTDGGTDAAKDVAVKKEAGPTPTPDGGTDDGGQTGPTVDPQCTVPAIGNGSCNPALDDAGITCNAITNAGCDGGAGEACDFDQNGGLSCFPAPNDQAGLCGLRQRQRAVLPGLGALRPDGQRQRVRPHVLQRFGLHARPLRHANARLRAARRLREVARAVRAPSREAAPQPTAGGGAAGGRIVFEGVPAGLPLRPVDPAVDLDDEPPRRAREVHDVRAAERVRRAAHECRRATRTATCLRK